MIQRLLRGRMLYLLLAVATPAAYLWAKGQPTRILTQTSSEVISEAFARTPDLASLEANFWKHPDLAFASLLSAFVLLSMLVISALISARALAKGSWRTFFVFPNALPSSFSIGELWRMIALSASLLFWLPVLRLGIEKLFLAARISVNAWLLGTTLFIDAFVIAVVLAFAAGKTFAPRQLFGLWPQRPKEAFRIAYRSYLGLFPWIFVVLFVISGIVHYLGYEPPVPPIQRMMKEDQGSFQTLMVLLACVIGPIAEEIFFRGVVFASLRRHLPIFWAIAGSAGLFALLHGNWIGLLPIMILGGLLAYLYERTGTLTVPIVVHIFHNSFQLWNVMLFNRLLQLS